MPITHIASTAATGTGTNGNATPAIDTTGANLLVAVVSYLTSTPPTLSDSKGNTWTALNAMSSGGSNAGSARLYYCVGPTVGSGHTFTTSGFSSYSTLAVSAFAGVMAAAPLDGQSAGGGSSSATTIQPGSRTPSVDGCVLVTGLQYLDATSSAVPSLNSSFTKAAHHSTNAVYAPAIGYKIQTTAGAENPMWSTNAAAERVAAVMAAFKPAEAVPTITTSSLPDGTAGQPYNFQLEATGGSGSLSWAEAGIVSGLPTGLSLDSSGLITGTLPLTPATYTFDVDVTDSLGQTDSATFTITVNEPTIAETRWSRMGIVPMGGLLAWHEADAIEGLSDGDDVSVVPDLSGNARDLAVASSKPIYQADPANGHPAVYFDGSRDPLVWTGELHPKHIFVVAAYEDEEFGADYAGLLSSATASVGGDVLVGDAGTTKFFDFGYGGGYSYRRRDVAFGEDDQQAAFSGQLAVFEIARPEGFNMDAIQVGRHAAFATRNWKGRWVGQMMYDRILPEWEGHAVYAYFAMKYFLWRQVASGLDVFPFQPEWGYATPTAKTVLESRSISGAYKGRIKGDATDTMALKFLTRIPEEDDAAKAFWDEKYPGSKFIYRDDSYSPARDSEVRFASAIDRQRNDYRDIDYGFMLEQA